MPDTFAITVIFVILSAVLGVFIRGRSKDRILLSFKGFSVNFENLAGDNIFALMNTENSAIEFIFSGNYFSEDTDSVKKTFILYKNEYSQIKRITRTIDQLDGELLKKREKDIARATSFSWKIKRKIQNFFGTVKDSFMEIVDLFIGRVRKSNRVVGVLKGQDKYINRMQKDAVEQICTSYEPILERYIGKRVIVPFSDGDSSIEYSGVLKDYTAQFIELFDVVDTNSPTDNKKDIIIPRSLGAVRFLSE